MIKAVETKEQKQKRHVGLTNVKVRSVNPTRSELNKLYGKEDEEDDREIVYKTADSRGNDRIRLNFWMLSEDLDKFLCHTIGIVDKLKENADGTKKQYINSSCRVLWVESEDQLPKWFTHFLDKDGNEIAKKEYRQSYVGEEELASLLRSWLKIKWNDPRTMVLVDVRRLLNEDYQELRDLIDSGYDTPFTALLGVRTDDNDSEKDYQTIYEKSFLPYNFKDFIENGNFPSSYYKNAWEKFEKEVTGDYGFKHYFELVPVTEYDRSKDLARSNTTKAGITVTNSKY